MLQRFGLTATEAAAYLALLEEGSATGYAVARRMSVARANAYAALEGLADRGLVRREDGQPSLYHPLPPAAAVAVLAAEHAANLDALEVALRRLPGSLEPTLERLTGDRPARAVVERLGARAKAAMRGVVPPEVARALEPFARGLRARGVAVDLRPADDGPAFVLIDADWALLWLPGGLGLWGNEPLLTASVQRLLAT